MNRIFLMRHGDAEDANTTITDAERQLTERGRGGARACGLALLALGHTSVVVASSTLLRARQSAAIVADVVGASVPIETDTLDPGFDPTHAWSFVESQTYDSIVLVSHAPSIGLFASALTSDAPHQFQFRKSSVMCLSSTAQRNLGHYQVEWFRTPEQLSEIANR